MDFGIVGDAHAADWHRQVSLLAVESIDKMIAAGATVSPGNFAENITTEGIELSKLPVGKKLRIGENVELAVTQIGKECHSRCTIYQQIGDCSRCTIYQQIGDCIMPREGIFAKVTKSGSIKIGDIIEV
jgi:MOSC domain-containing protein YiiM